MTMNTLSTLILVYTLHLKSPHPGQFCKCRLLACGLSMNVQLGVERYEAVKGVMVAHLIHIYIDNSLFP